jgi:hypothetical protein
MTKMEQVPSELISAFLGVWIVVGLMAAAALGTWFGKQK